MMSYQHHVAAQCVGRLPQQAALDDLADIAHQQQRTVRSFDAQHATGFVAQIRKMRPGMQEAETHAIPIPLVTRPARTAARRRHALRPQHARNRQRRLHRSHTTGMVVVAMAEDGRIQALYAQRMQARQDRAFAGIEAFRNGRPRIIKKGMPGRPDYHR